MQEALAELGAQALHFRGRFSMTKAPPSGKFSLSFSAVLGPVHPELLPSKAPLANRS